MSSDLADIRLHPQQIGIEHLQSFVPTAKQIDQAKDNRLTTLAKNISQCSTNQAATTWIMETQPWEMVATYFNTIDLVSHSFMYFHPPQLPHVPQDLYETYNNVVNETYRFHDLMLGRLMQLAGDETTVIVASDHGYQSGNNRPQLTSAEPAGAIAWHRPFGMIAMKGPGIKKDELMFGARILDLTPTILALLGLPVGEDMAGRPMTQALMNSNEFKIETIPSWEDVHGDDGMHDPETLSDPLVEMEMMKQLEALGYIEPMAGDKQAVLEKTADELRFNVARSLISLTKYRDAIPELESLVAKYPERLEASFKLAECYQAEGEFEKSKAIIDRIAAGNFESNAIESRTAKLSPQINYMYGLLELGSGN
ncbi:MAG: alkaline phosphatase family protein, partial [Planctomycetota bacterium]